MDFTDGHDNIEVRSITSFKTDLWGSYIFAFPICSSATANDGVIPFGDTISSVSVKSYLGYVTAKSTIANETEITDLIDPAFTPTITSSYKVNVKFQYPADQKGKKATLIFEITLAGAGKQLFYFHSVEIK